MMSRRIVYAALAVTVLVALAVATLWIAGHTWNWEPGWGSAQLKVAERAYCSAQVKRVLDTWRAMARDAMGPMRPGRAAQDSFVCLVIDTTEKAVWIERDGKTMSGCRIDLPKGIPWTLRRCGPDTNVELAGPARFRIRGLRSARQPKERIVLLGQSEGGQYLEFSFTGTGGGSRYGSGTWAPKATWWNSGSQRPGEEAPYESLLVSDAEYAEAQAGFPAGEAQTEPDQPDQFTENLAAWERVAKHLYQEIDRHVAAEGFDLGMLDVRCGPDYSAASANLHAARTGWLRGLLGLRSSAQAYLKVDRLEGDIWYVKTAPDPRRPAPKGGQLKLEFLVSASDKPARQHRARLIQTGRARQADAPKPPSKWQMELPNGIKVAFIGVCENPSAGKEWWGPDGSRLGYTPYSNYERYTPFGEDQTVYEIALNVARPASGRFGTRSSLLEGCRGTFGRQTRDRYGNPTLSGFRAQGYAFDKSQKKTTLELGVRVGDGDHEWVRFENISLVPGEDPGFQILEGPGDTE